MRHALLTLSVLAAPVWVDAWADRFVCEPVDAATPGHSPAVLELQAALPPKPAEIQYCHGPSPRWVARWAPFETLDGWRLFATAFCFENSEPLQCHVRRHVAVAGSHQVIDLTYEIALERVRELFEAARQAFPDAEVMQIDYVEVTDGGAWSPQAHGYDVRLLEPPAFEDGSIQTFVRRCTDACRWVHAEQTAVWFGGPGLMLRALERERGEPIIDHLDYLGR